jgi:hypothetical protein
MMQSDRFLRIGVFPLMLLGAARIALAGVNEETPAFRDFTQRVQQYLKLQKSMPRIRTTKQRKEIVERRTALAQKIREMRATAKPGDIFTPEVSEEFRRAIRAAFQGPSASNVRQTIRQGEPVPGWRPTINGDYPEDLPLTTVPPTLLQRLPQLPSEVAYRIVGHDLVLQDTEARVVIDFIAGALP